MAMDEMNPASILLAPIARNWRLVLVRGLAAIVFGIACFVVPAISLLALVLLYGVYAIVDGISAVVWGSRSRWPAMVVVGAISVLSGLVAFFWPAITALALLYVIAAWAIVRGVAEISAAMHLRRQVSNEWILAGSGAVSIVLGVLLAVFPGAGVLSVLWLIGLFAIAFGGLGVALAVRLRSMEYGMRVGQEEPPVGAAAGAQWPDEHIRGRR
jgi:uncharacterized membrane protein HdeD (DUF308 family)